MTNEIIAQLAAFIALEIIHQTDYVIEPEEAIISSGLIDSLSLVDLSLYIEDTFGVQIDDTELNADSFDNLDQLSSMIVGRKG